MNPRIEEVSDTDSEPAEMDPSVFDPKQHLLSPSNVPAAAIAQPAAPFNPQLAPHMRGSAAAQVQDAQRSKHWQVIYPVYFDANRTRAEGRRVSKELAVQNPLARELVDAVASMGLHVVFEPGKTHPKDWSNPGRVRCLVKEDGRSVAGGVKNKHHLYILISAYLRAHPTTPASPLRLKIAGLPLPKGDIPPPAIPRGWKMNTILPLHSPAMSGGGVSDNLFKEMMADMQGEPAGAGAGEGKKKKDRKKKG